QWLALPGHNRKVASSSLLGDERLCQDHDWLRSLEDFPLKRKNKIHTSCSLLHSHRAGDDQIRRKLSTNDANIKKNPA
ncbi:6667_t:CDS:1, partial [Ambispora leptoticha]